MSESTNMPDPGEVPVLDWLDVSLLDVDPLYQRPEDEKRVSKIANGFRWDRFGALVVAPKEGGRYSIIDGQHRARAAQLHPAVSVVPAVIITADGVSEEAASFVGINAERKNTSALELFFGQLAAGDDDAETIRQVCDRAGVRIPKHPQVYKPADCIAVAAIQALVGRRGAMRARQILEVLAKAELAPISANQIKATEALLLDDEFGVEADDLTATIVTMGPAADAEAKMFAATHRCSAWKGLASVWFQRCRKRRKAA